MAAAEQLPAGLAGQLLDPAREAFTNGLNVVAGVGTVAVLLFAVVAIVALRQVRPAAAEPAPEPQPAEPAAPPTAEPVAEPELVGAC